MRWLALVWLTTLSLSAAPGGRVDLVRNGRSGHTICLAPEASPGEKRGAQELQKFLEEMSGARLPIETNCPDGKRIFVGRSPALDKLGIAIPYQDLGAEGFVLKTAGQDLIIAGGRQRGSMYGVYTFLEKLGCRWFSRDVSRIPRQRTIRVGPLDETGKPAFEYREPFFTEAFDKDWAARNKTNGDHSRLDESTGGKLRYYPFVHSFYTMIPPEKYFKDHPEYFSLIDGKRRVERGQLCLTNPGLLRESVAAVLEWIRTHPEATIYSVSQNDWTGWCECDNCRRVEEEEGGAHSGPLLRFVNALAEQVGAKHPDKLIDTLAYWYTEAPPSKVRPRPNVRIRLCPIGACEAHPYERCERNAYFVRNLKAWSQITNQLYIWHYNTNFAHYLMPFPDFDELAADIPMYHRHGVVGLFLQGAYAQGGGGESAELRSYVMARLLWDVKTDANRAVDEFLEASYGRAARPMRQYFDLLHRQVRMPPAGKGHHIWIFMHPGAPHLARGFLDEARKLFAKAERAADSEAVRERVRKARLSIDYVDLVQSMKMEFRPGEYAPADLPKLKARFDGFLTDARHFGIESLHEGRNLSYDEKEFATRLRPYKLATLEDPAARVDLAADLNGRVLRFLDKASGENLLRLAFPGERGYPDLSGLWATAHADYQGAAWDVSWKLASAGADQATLTGVCPNGIRLRRLLKLEGGRLRTETVAENPTSAPVEVVLAARAEYTGGPPEDARLGLAFRSQGGESVARTLFRPGEETSGLATYTGSQRPAGEWRVFHPQARLALLNRFPSDHAERCAASWSMRGENRVTLIVWSRHKSLAPGESLKLEADYQAGRP